MSKLTDELTLANALRAYRVQIFDGLTTFAERREHARHAIRAKELATTKHEKQTYGELFLLAYGETL